jgi:hypothetical protein
MDNLTPRALSLSNPWKLIEFMTVFSPVILGIVVFSMTFIFQNPKGFIFLIIFLIVSGLREFVLYLMNAQKFFAKGNFCTMMQYGQYSNVGYIIFIATFTFVYLFTPMFYNNDYNYLALGGYLTYLLTISWLLMNQSCMKLIDVFLNMFSGGLVGVLVLAAIIGLNLKDYLFFNEVSSNKNVCSMPSKQTFKCSVYKNGELVGST